MARPAVGIQACHRRNAGKGEGRHEKYCEGEIAWRLSADEQNDACHKDDEGNVANGKLSKHKLEYSHRTCEHEQQQIVLPGMVEGIAHPSGDGRGGGSIRFQCGYVGRVQEDKECCGAELANEPSNQNSRSWTLLTNPQPSIDSQGGRKQQRRVVRQHCEVEACC